MGAWVLIFYMTSTMGTSGGPGTAYFQTEAACAAAADAMQKRWSGCISATLCLPTNPQGR